MKPSTNTGIEAANAVNTVVRPSANEYLLIADSTPAEMPIVVSMKMAQMARRRLLGKVSPRMSDTGRREA